jgi:hypothetical protein
LGQKAFETQLQPCSLHALGLCREDPATDQGQLLKCSPVGAA